MSFVPYSAGVSQNPTGGQAGRPVEGFTYEIASSICSAAVPFGRGVVKMKGVTGVTDDDDEECQLPPNVPAADVDAIIASGASTNGVQVWTADGTSSLDFDGVIGYRKSIYGRPIQITTNSHADWNATTCYLSGFDVNGAQVWDSILLTADGAATDLATFGVGFAQVTKFILPAQTGANGTFTLGYQGATTAQTVDLFGVAIVNDAGESATTYAAAGQGSFLRRGRIWVTVENAVTRGQQAFLRHTSDGGSNTALGTWRGDWDAGRAAAVPWARFMTAAGAAGLAQLEVSL